MPSQLTTGMVLIWYLRLRKSCASSGQAKRTALNSSKRKTNPASAPDDSSGTVHRVITSLASSPKASAPASSTVMPRKTCTRGFISPISPASQLDTVGPVMVRWLLCCSVKSSWVERVGKTTLLAISMDIERAWKGVGVSRCLPKAGTNLTCGRMRNASIKISRESSFPTSTAEGRRTAPGACTTMSTLSSIPLKFGSDTCSRSRSAESWRL